MTKNQIEYQKLQETKRANRAQERLTQRRDSNTYALGVDTLAETRRHNQQVELETTRHNTTYEGEVQRHNMVVEDQSLISLGIQQQNADTNRHQAETARINARTNQGMLSETVRSNLAREAETHRSNVMNETLQAQRHAETIRSNMAQESISAERNRISQQEADTRAQVGASQIDLNATSGSLNAAREAQVSKQTSYLGQENVRDWIHTGTDVLDTGVNAYRAATNSANQAVGNLIKLIDLFN